MAGVACWNLPPNGDSQVADRSDRRCIVRNAGMREAPYVQLSGVSSASKPRFCMQLPGTAETSQLCRANWLTAEFWKDCRQRVAQDRLDRKTIRVHCNEERMLISQSLWCAGGLFLGIRVLVESHLVNPAFVSRNNVVHQRTSWSWSAIFWNLHKERDSMAVSTRNRPTRSRVQSGATSACNCLFFFTRLAGDQVAAVDG